jgi:hypothetical protein
MQANWINITQCEAAALVPYLLQADHRSKGLLFFAYDDPCGRLLDLLKWHSNMAVASEPVC